MENQSTQTIAFIEEMISKTKQKYSESGFLFLVWGWLVLLASITNYVLMIADYANASIVWAILMPLGGIISMVYSYRDTKKAYVKTYTDDVMKYTWIAFGVLLTSIILSMNLLQLNTYPLIIIAYGVPTFITAGVLKFKPMLYGAIGNWVLGLLAFHYSLDVQLLFLSAAVLISYILPGHILRYQYLKNKK